MKIVLIGFSGSGKTHWSGKLVNKLGYHHICCDDLIAEMLTHHLPAGYSDTSDLALWMGKPYDTGYRENESLYLSCERKVLEGILSTPPAELPKNTILDTTGSVIYLDKGITRRLKQFGKVVYLEVPQRVLNRMFQLYVADPKPVVWGRSFSQLPEESSHQALARSYPELLNYRKERYEELADVCLDYDLLRFPGFGPHEFLEAAGN